MEETLAHWVGVILTAKILAGLIRRDFGNAPDSVAALRSEFCPDIAYLAVFAACIFAVQAIGLGSALPIAILLRLGGLLNFRIVIAANHLCLELLILLIILRLREQPMVMISTIQAATISVWLYAAFQKLYHRQFSDGTFFYIAFQSPGNNNRWKTFEPSVTKLNGYYAKADPASQKFCRRLALFALTTEVSLPLVALAASGTVWSFLILSVLSLGVAFMTKETNFMLTNILLAACFLVPFNPAALGAVSNDWLASGIIGWLCLWPVFHAVITSRIRFSPWKLAGWGMYATLLPSVELIAPNGDLVTPPVSGFPPFFVLQMCGVCKIRGLREYARRLFNRWYRRGPVKAFLFRFHQIRGDQYFSSCFVLANLEGAEPIEFELKDDASVATFLGYLARPEPSRSPSGELSDGNLERSAADGGLSEVLQTGRN